MRSQFEGTDGWGSPTNENLTVDGDFVLNYYVRLASSVALQRPS